MKIIVAILFYGAIGFFLFTQIRGIITDIKAKRSKKEKVVKADEGKETETAEN